MIKKDLKIMGNTLTAGLSNEELKTLYAHMQRMKENIS